MRSTMPRVFVWLVVAVAAAVGRAQQPCCCEVPCRLLDPLGQDPLWTARTDALLLWRDAPQAQPLFDFADPADPVPLGVALDAANFRSDMAAGPRFALFRHTGDMGAIEFNFLRVQTFNSALSLPQRADTVYLDAGPRGLYCCDDTTPRDTVAGSMSSSLQSAEVNRRFPTDGRLGWLMGFRWVEWNDALGLQSASLIGNPLEFTNSYLTQTNNDLYGLQIGADSILYGLGRRFRVEGIGKTGIYYNDARQMSSFTTTLLDGESLAVATDVGRAAFVGELGVTGVYDITQHIAFRAGYTIFWLGGLALAPEQYAANTLCPENPIQGGTDTSGSVVVQGLSLGLEARW